MGGVDKSSTRINTSEEMMKVESRTKEDFTYNNQNENRVELERIDF